MIKNLFILFCFVTTVGFSQVDEIAPPNYVKTITFKGNTAQGQLPILKLGEYFQLEFDVLNGDEDDYYYEINHYNFDWTASQLSESEYLKGFNEQRIRHYSNSFNTYQIYSHYVVKIPNEQTQGLKVSGNYIITVYDENDDIMFSRKFMVYENLVDVGVAIKRSRVVETISEKQSVDIVINSKKIQFNNPKKTVKTLVIQNNNLNTAITTLKPQYILGNELAYRYTDKSSFDAGNEFLYFENKDLRGANVGVQHVELNDLFNTYLHRDFSRKKNNYTYNPDINGNFLINALDKNNPSIEADYAFVHFTLKIPKFEIADDETLYVYGNFNNYQLEPLNKMEFDDLGYVYKTSFLLKQGFYNYKYIVVNAKGELNNGAISGNFYQTENEYSVIVYYRDLGARYDRIVGVGKGNSLTILN